MAENTTRLGIAAVAGFTIWLGVVGCNKLLESARQQSSLPTPTPDLSQSGLGPSQRPTVEIPSQGFTLPWLGPQIVPTRPPEALATLQVLSSAVSRSLDLGQGPCYPLLRAARDAKLSGINPCVDWQEACFIVDRFGITEEYRGAAAIIREFNQASGGTKIVHDNEGVYVGPDCSTVYSFFGLPTAQPERRYK